MHKMHKNSEENYRKYTKQRLFLYVKGRKKRQIIEN